MHADTSAVTSTTELALSPAEAFSLFSEGLDRWWPRDFSWSQDVLEEVRLESREQGLLSEIGPRLSLRLGRRARVPAEMMGSQGWPVALERLAAAAAE
jgi:hypothetical protein